MWRRVYGFSSQSFPVEFKWPCVPRSPRGLSWREIWRVLDIKTLQTTSWAGILKFVTRVLESFTETIYLEYGLKDVVIVAFARVCAREYASRCPSGVSKFHEFAKVCEKGAVSRRCSTHNFANYTGLKRKRDFKNGPNLHFYAPLRYNPPPKYLLSYFVLHFSLSIAFAPLRLRNTESGWNFNGTSRTGLL